MTTQDESTEGEVLRYASDSGAEHLPNHSLNLPAVDPTAGFDERCEQVMECAEVAFSKTGSWVVFFREMLGPTGLVRRVFGGSTGRLDDTELKRFIASEHYTTLNEMVAAIRSQDDSKSNAVEPERMITIRIPRSLHELLKEEAVHCKLSINKLAISKLLQPTNSRYVPEQRGKLRGRRPGPQPMRERPTSQKRSAATPATPPKEKAEELESLQDLGNGQWGQP
ncbi:MAG: hypothetical protein AAGJ83_03825 [Planctomycetota bacterium]